ncbi:MAG: hypothetical protein QXL18_02400, partial [Candidatus Woesearchaeota archaeon]
RNNNKKHNNILRTNKTWNNTKNNRKRNTKNQRTNKKINYLKINKPILYDIVDKLSSEVTDIAPKFMEDKPIASNMLYGFLGSYIITKIGTKIVSKNLNPKSLKIYLKLENIVSKILPFTAFGYAIIDPDGAKELMQTHQYIMQE